MFSLSPVFWNLTLLYLGVVFPHWLCQIFRGPFQYSNLRSVILENYSFHHSFPSVFSFYAAVICNLLLFSTFWSVLLLLSRLFFSIISLTSNSPFSFLHTHILGSGRVFSYSSEDSNWFFSNFLLLLHCSYFSSYLCQLAIATKTPHKRPFLTSLVIAGSIYFSLTAYGRPVGWLVCVSCICFSLFWDPPGYVLMLAAKSSRGQAPT